MVNTSYGVFSRNVLLTPLELVREMENSSGTTIVTIVRSSRSCIGPPSWRSRHTNSLTLRITLISTTNGSTAR